MSAAIVVIGRSIYLYRDGSKPTDYRVFRGEPVNFRTIHGIVTSATGGSGHGLIQFGLLVLIAAPIVRVLSSVLGFARERDWLYVAITACVRLLLGYSLLAV